MKYIRTAQTSYNAAGIAYDISLKSIASVAVKIPPTAMRLPTVRPIV